MTAIIASTNVDRPAASVSAYATDPTHFQEWQTGVISGHMEGGTTPTVGAHCVTTRRIGLANRPSTSELVHLDPPNAWSVHGIDGPIRATVDVTVRAISDTQSTVTIAVDFQGCGIGRVLVPLVVRREARKEMPANLAALKAHLEDAPTIA
jgi:hypothetical protein